MDKSMLVNINGEIISGDEPVFSSLNRGFLYGDGLFESIRLVNGKMPLYDLHYQRLQNGCALLKLDLPENYTAAYFKEQILKLAKKKGLTNSARIRLTLYRSEGGLYLPEDNTAKYIIKAEPTKIKNYVLNQKGLKVDIYPDIEKPTSKFSNFKTCNALIYVLASLYKEEHGLDDCLLLNWKSRVIESISSNLFLVKDGELNTPPLAEGCINGVMRTFLIDLIKEEGLTLHENPINLEDLFSADECFITNAVYGIRWIEHYKSKTYLSTISERLSLKLNEKVMSLK